MMQSFKQTFIDLLLQYQCLSFGSFTLKSGRKSPYFYDASSLNNGEAISKLGQCYAHAIMASGISFDVLFGPAYKGIPILCATANALYRDFGRSVPYCFNRKTLNGHNGGDAKLIGAPLKGQVLVVDDVVTSGMTLKETIALIASEAAQISGIFVSLDRQELGINDSLSAIQEIKQKCGVKIFSIATIDDVLNYLKATNKHPNVIQEIELYQAKYGV